MSDMEAPIGEFERGAFVFAVHRDGEVHRVEAREGDSAPVLVCHIYNRYTSAAWSSGWQRDSWRPWIEQQAHRIIAEAEEPEGDRSPVAQAQQDHIPQ